MRQAITLLAALLVLAAAGGLYHLKHRVEARRAAVRALEQQIVTDAEALRVLQAEWAYLTSPQLLQDRAVRYLRLGPPVPEQVVSSLTVLPFRAGDLLAAARGEGAGALPAPRFKPPAPRRDMLVAERAPEVQPYSPALHRASAPSDFATRMAHTLDRLGGRP